MYAAGWHMAVLNRDARAALIERVMLGLTTAEDAQLLDRLLPRSEVSRLDDLLVRQMRETWAEWLRDGSAHSMGRCGRGYGRLGAQYRVAPSTARNIVHGHTRLSAGGPIDCDGSVVALRNNSTQGISMRKNRGGDS